MPYDGTGISIGASSLTAHTTPAAIGNQVAQSAGPRLNNDSPYFGNPAWVSFSILITNPVNQVTFSLDFTSAAGAKGLLTTYWNGEELAVFDEQYYASGSETQTVDIPNAVLNQPNVLSFRLDPFSEVPSSASISAIYTSFIGLVDPISLQMLSNTASGGQIELHGPSGYTFVVEGSTNLVEWTPVAVVGSTNNGTSEPVIIPFIDPERETQPRRFYRAIAP